MFDARPTVNLSSVDAWSRWHRPQSKILPLPIKSWLTEPGSLTRRLQQSNEQTFSVDLLVNHWCRALPDESLYLNIPFSQLTFQREVRLMDGNKARVYARTVIPMETYRAMPHRFNSLGTRPLGEVLFTDPNVERGVIEVACLKPGQWLYELAVRTESVRPDWLWARRSCFYLSGKKLLVNEIFLPTL